MYLRFLSLGLGLTVAVTALADNHEIQVKDLIVPEITLVTPGHPSLKTSSMWSKQKRKMASAQALNARDLASDFVVLRNEWLQVKTGDEMEKLLKRSQTGFDKYTMDTKYFVTQMQLLLPLRGITWRMRPLFESNKGFLGNKSTHVAAVQAVRGSVVGMTALLPTSQTDASIQFFTEPSKDMTKADQFKSIAEFQKYMMQDLSPAITVAINRLQDISSKQNKIFVWDNNMAFGHGTFKDGIRQFKGNGPAEVKAVISSLYKAQHSMMVYSAYNQDYSIKLAGELGSHIGIDSGVFGSKSDLGITAEEKVELLKKAAKNHHFLELRDYQGTKYGTELMSKAFVALQNSVTYANESYKDLQKGEDNKSMVLNPILFQPELAENLEAGIANIKDAIAGEATIRDPITAQEVSIDVPAFYHNPPASLSVLMPTHFDQGASEKEIVNAKGEKLAVRNYLRGRAVGWNNEAWQKYVTSAKGKDKGYMAEANKVIQYSFGTGAVFGLPGIFVQ